MPLAVSERRPLAQLQVALLVSPIDEL
jgi:hypothetical protein